MSSLPGPSPAVTTSNPTTPAYANDLEWITAYLVIHMISVPSRHYAYVLWFVVVFGFLVFTLLRWIGSRGGVVGAYWSKWSLRRRTWCKKHRLAVASKKGKGHNQPTSLPSNAQLLCLLVLLLISFALCFIGPDYISPRLGLWQLHSSDPSSFLQTRDQSYDPSLFYQYQPQYTIQKAWWTSGGRTGVIAFSLFPLCVLFALKAPPFAVFAIPYMVQLHFDKLAWLHRWSGRLIWLISSLHVALWSVQLATDRRQGTGQVAYQYAWLYEKFIFGWIAFALLTLLILLSLFPVRRKFYKAFYFLHVLLVPLTLVMAALHHPPVWWWCWAALALWAGERLWRGTWWLHTNGFFGGSAASSPQLSGNPRPEAWELKPSDKIGSPYSTPTSSHFLHPHSPLNPTSENAVHSAHPNNRELISLHPSASSHNLLPSISTGHYIPPPGYAHAELLSGRTIRLHFITPGFLSWAPGQHFLVTIPSVSKLFSHPFTTASVCDEQAPSEVGREIIFLVRAKQGWTKDLWDLVLSLTGKGNACLPSERPSPSTNMPTKGVLLKMYVDGPFGSSVRARWNSHSTVLIIAGGSGVSFGLSVLQYVCMCLAGRDGRHLGGQSGGWGMKGFSTARVRFVWLVREFSHVQWCASVIRKCLSLIPPPGLQVDIFVTNFKPVADGRRRGRASPLPSPSFSQLASNEQELVPPTPRFIRKTRSHSRSHSMESTDSFESCDGGVDNMVDLSYYTGDFGDEELEEGADSIQVHQSNLLDLTNFDGDEDIRLPGEEALNRTVKKAGKLRRAKTRKATTALHAKKELRASREQNSQDHDTRSSVTLLAPDFYDGHRTTRTSLEIESSNPKMSSENIPYTPPLLQPLRTSFQHVESSTPSPRPISTISQTNTEVGSFRELMPRSCEEFKLEMDGHEMDDLEVVSEHARPGKPKVAHILADEVQQAQGPIIVACCGPSSLNSMVRKAIASQIDPGRIRRGDGSGSITLVSEEFEY